MKTIRKERMIPVNSSTPEGLAQAFNNAVDELTGISYEKIWNLSNGNSLFLIYTETVKVPETLEDEYLLRGEQKFCRDCPWFDAKNEIIGRCEHPKIKVKTKAGYINANGSACEHLYEVLEEGERA